MNDMIRQYLRNFYERYCQAWLWLLDFIAGLPFLMVGFLFRFVREWFSIGCDLYDFLNEMNQKATHKVENQ